MLEMLLSKSELRKAQMVELEKEYYCKDLKNEWVNYEEDMWFDFGVDGTLQWDTLETHMEKYYEE